MSEQPPGLRDGERDHSGVRGIPARRRHHPPVIRRGFFRSVLGLTDAIGAFVDTYNDRCQPFAWTKDADRLLASIKPDSLRTNTTRHQVAGYKQAWIMGLDTLNPSLCRFVMPLFGPSSPLPSRVCQQSLRVLVPS